MKIYEAKQLVGQLLAKAGIALNDDGLVIPENLDFETALSIENEIEDISFINEDGLKCNFQIIDDKLVVCEL